MVLILPSALSKPLRKHGQSLLYYCDESHITSEFGFMGIGGLAVTPTRQIEMSKDLERIRNACNFPSDKEVKWKAAKQRRDCVYSEYLNYLFNAIEANHIQCHFRFVPMNDYSHMETGVKDRSDTISKAFYQIFLHRVGRYYSKQCRVSLRPDNGNCTEYLPKMAVGLNNDICSKYNVDQSPIVDIKPQDSSRQPLLQLLDVALGALTAARNDRHNNGKLGSFKTSLIESALAQGNVSDITASDHPNKRNFNIWNVQPKHLKSAVPMP